MKLVKFFTSLIQKPRKLKSSLQGHIGGHRDVSTELLDKSNLNPSVLGGEVNIGEGCTKTFPTTHLPELTIPLQWNESEKIQSSEASAIINSVTTFIAGGIDSKRKISPDYVDISSVMTEVGTDIETSDNRNDFLRSCSHTLSESESESQRYRNNYRETEIMIPQLRMTLIRGTLVGPKGWPGNDFSTGMTPRCEEWSRFRRDSDRVLAEWETSGNEPFFSDRRHHMRQLKTTPYSLDDALQDGYRWFRNALLGCCALKEKKAGE